MRIAQFTAIGPDNKEYQVELTAEENRYKDEVTLTYSVTGAEEVTSTVNLDLSDGSIRISGLALSAAATGYVACLMMCGLGHIVQEILDCWRRGNRQPKALIKCLRSKGVSITLSLVNCALACLGGLVGGGGSAQP